MAEKEIISGFSILLTFIGYAPYIKWVITRQVRAHLFSWVIWSITTCIVFVAQIEGDGGAGAWPTGVGGVITILIAVLAYVKGRDHSVTTLDKVFFIGALSSLPLWYVTNDPLWAVVILTSVDLLGFGPTIRQAYDNPLEESATFFGIFVLRNLLSLFALECYSVTTMLFPVATGVACLLLIAVLLVRRK
ncbi:MAG: hypothetical protein OCD01_15050 [Fibrobacterales bacterium]